MCVLPPQTQLVFDMLFLLKQIKLIDICMLLTKVVMGSMLIKLNTSPVKFKLKKRLILKYILDSE